jgi:hypothetical protein
MALVKKLIKMVFAYCMSLCNVGFPEPISSISSSHLKNQDCLVVLTTKNKNSQESMTYDM